VFAQQAHEGSTSLMKVSQASCSKSEHPVARLFTSVTVTLMDESGNSKSGRLVFSLSRKHGAERAQ